jgi:hypothetical protein
LIFMVVSEDCASADNYGVRVFTRNGDVAIVSEFVYERVQELFSGRVGERCPLPY